CPTTSQANRHYPAQTGTCSVSMLWHVPRSSPSANQPPPCRAAHGKGEETWKRHLAALRGSGILPLCVEAASCRFAPSAISQPRSSCPKPFGVGPFTHSALKFTPRVFTWDILHSALRIGMSVLSAKNRLHGYIAVHQQLSRLQTGYTPVTRLHRC